MPLRIPFWWFSVLLGGTALLFSHWRAERKNESLSFFLISLALLIGGLSLFSFEAPYLYVPFCIISALFGPQVFTPVWLSLPLIEIKNFLDPDIDLILLLSVSVLSGGFSYFALKRTRNRVMELSQKLEALEDDSAVLSSGDVTLKEAAEKELRNALNMARESIGADSASIFQLNGAELVLKISTATDIRPLKEGLLWLSLKNNKTIILNSSVQNPGYERDVKISSFMASPLHNGGEITGVIAADSKRPDAFSGRDSMAIESIASLMEGMLSRQRVYIETERKLKEFEVLKEESSKLLRSLELKDIAAEAVKALGRIVPVGAALFIKKSGEYELIGSAGLKEPEKRRFKTLKGTLLESVIQTGQRLYISDLSAYHIPPLPFTASLKTGTLRSALLEPLTGRRGVIGLLALLSDKRNPLTFHQLDTIKLFGEQMSVTLSRAFLHEEMKLMATTDGLTGLYNHRHFQEKLSDEFKRLGRYPRPLSLLMADIDFFKKVNDTYGHPAGDAVLKGLAGILLKVVRETDIPARYGGEEFAAILTDTDKKGAQQVAERLRKAIMDYSFTLEGRTLKVTVSIGIASFPTDARSKEVLIELADKALYRAKHEGRNRVAVAAGAPELRIKS